MIKPILSDLSMLADAAMEYMNNETQRTADTKTEKQDEPPPLGKLIIVYKNINLSWSFY